MFFVYISTEYTLKYFSCTSLKNLPWNVFRIHFYRIYPEMFFVYISEEYTLKYFLCGKVPCYHIQVSLSNFVYQKQYLSRHLTNLMDFTPIPSYVEESFRLLRLKNTTHSQANSEIKSKLFGVDSDCKNFKNC